MTTALATEQEQQDQQARMAHYRNKPVEVARVADLLRLVPGGLDSALDIGARDGHLSVALTEKAAQVTALDLVCPLFSAPRVRCVQGDATALAFADNAIDIVLCAEVLEHIPSPGLEAACREIARVAKHCVVIGVPYRQDIREAKTSCKACGKTNPPWAHVNSFDEQRLRRLFPSLCVDEVSFVGIGLAGTNWLSSALMTFAGNPYGTYVQAEPCVHCGARLAPPAARSTLQRVATRAAVVLDRVLALTAARKGNWIHIRFVKQAQTRAAAVAAPQP